MVTRPSADVIDRWWADTLVTVEAQQPGTRFEMFDRMWALFDLLADRASWPR
jgi:hypothetical protein